MSMLIQNKNILIIGASGGIGNEIVNRFHKDNNIFFTSSSEEKASNIYSTFPNNQKMSHFIINLKEHSKINEMIKVASDFFNNQIDILICNAGMNKDTLSIRMKDNDWQDVIDVNLTSTFFINREVLKLMLKKQSGKIVNISSVVGLTGNAGQANYVASKAGIIGMTKTLAMEFATKNIQINSIAPGFIETNMTNQMSQEAKDFILSKIPMKKYGSPSDVVNGIEFLCSDMSNYITGTVLDINGGMFMQ